MCSCCFLFLLSFELYEGHSEAIVEYIFQTQTHTDGWYLLHSTVALIPSQRSRSQWHKGLSQTAARAGRRNWNKWLCSTALDLIGGCGVATNRTNKHFNKQTQTNANRNSIVVAVVRSANRRVIRNNPKTLKGAKNKIKQYWNEKQPNTQNSSSANQTAKCMRSHGWVDEMETKDLYFYRRRSY